MREDRTRPERQSAQRKPGATPRPAAPKPVGARASKPTAHRSAEPAIATALHPSPAAESASRHYRRARRDRGAETRARLIEAALDVFGRLGFEGASTRQIAKEAGANLAAIVYHFGSKEALQVAVAEHIVASIATRVGPVLAAAAGPAAAATPAAALAALETLIATLIDVILGSAEAERWARFIIREQLQPTAAFEVVYRFMGGAHEVASRLVAIILGRRPDEEFVRLRVFTALGQVMIFRVAQALVLRRMGWQAIGDTERAAVKAIIIGNVRTILGAEAKL